MKFCVNDRNKCRLVCVCDAKCLGGLLFWDTVVLVCSCIYVLTLTQCMHLLLEGIIANWYLSIVSMI